MKSLRQIIYLMGVLLLFLLVPRGNCLYAQAKENIFGHGETVLAYDTLIIFRFDRARLMHYRDKNEQSLIAAERLIKQYKKTIRDGHLKVAIQGYCGSYPNWGKNRFAVRNRSNQVKSYFIVFSGLKEEDYYTTNYVDYCFRNETCDIVVMTLVYADQTVPFFGMKPPFRTEVEFDSLPEPEYTLPFVHHDLDPMESYDIAPVPKKSHIFENIEWPAIAVKSNLLYDLLLAPSLSIEASFNKHWSAQMDFTIPWWQNDKKEKSYQLALITGEARYWWNPQERWHGQYVGVMGGGTWYDLQPGGRGYRGEAWLGGLTYGYMWPISKHLSLDAEVGVGYMQYRNREYLPLDGCNVYQKTTRTHYVGPIKLQLSLAWRFDLNNLTGKKGGVSDE